tara:strand:- start:32 stop:337 length:306 start_codon:yes stop_codon:yes gene_type:complete
MAIRKSKEKKLQVQDTLEVVKEKSLSALNQGGFKKIENNNNLNQITAKFNNFFVVGNIEIMFAKNDNGVDINLKSTANADNIFALFSSPNDKIMKSFTDNY